MTPTSHDLVCQGRGPHVTAWGSHGAAVVAWHGLARIGRGMDDIAAQLAQRWRVLSPDTLRLLQQRGHRVLLTPAMGSANSVEVLPEGRGSLGVADPRRLGAAAVVELPWP